MIEIDSNLYKCRSSVEHKKYFQKFEACEVLNSFMALLTAIVVTFPTLVVNSAPEHSSKYLLLGTV